MEHCHSIFCILTPEMLKNIAKNGTGEQRRWAVETLSTDHTFRTIRAMRVMRPAESVRGITGFAETGKPQRSLFDAQNKTRLPGRIVRLEGDPKTGDPAVDNVYDYLGEVYSFYWEILNRNSIDDEGRPLNAIVHYDKNYANAFWDGEQMVFGDGDGEIFNSFTTLDITGHELTHGVVEDETHLVYRNEPGALNESLSDVFGTLIRQKAENVKSKDDHWLIGKDLFTAKMSKTAKALRSMKAPGTAYNNELLGKDPQPAHMDDFVRTLDDNGGVHINSGIPNHAFYLTAIGLNAYAWEKAGYIWYDALKHLRQTSGFRTFARLTFEAAVKRYGEDSKEAEVVQKSWSDVGIQVLSQRAKLVEGPVREKAGKTKGKAEHAHQSAD